MGNCRNEQQLAQVTHIPSSFSPQVEPVMKSPAQSIRFGDIEKFRSSNTFVPNNYCFILPVKQSEELIKIQCPIISSYSDHLALKIPVLGGIQTTRADVRNSPIIDLHDTVNDNQILHRLLIKEGNSEKPYTVKVYPFKNYYDVWLKSGLYEALLYRQLNSFKKDNSFLSELFIMEKGAPKCLVFVFNNYHATLEDMIRYRRMNNEPYTRDEQLYIVQQLISKYKDLAVNMIVHRDIRPGKVYLAQLPGARYGAYSNHNLSYEFQNLESARKVTERELKSVNPSSLQVDVPMTVRGVATYSSRQVSAIQMKGEQFGIYDPFYNDRVGLAYTFASIVTLEIDSPIINYDLVRSKNMAVFDIITKLENLTVPFLEIYRGVTVSSANFGILESDKKICINYLPQIIRQFQRDRIQTATTEFLFTLHQRQLLTQRLDKLMNQNYRTNTPYENIAILDRLGRHYEGMGVKDNEYYNQEVSLLLQMAEEERLKGFAVDTILQQANEVAYEKLSGKLKNPQTNVNLKIENACAAAYKNNIQEASRIINGAMQEAGVTNKIAADAQIKLIKYKGIIESFINLESGDAYFEKGLQLSQKRSNFLTEVEMLQSQSDFRYLLGQNILKRIEKNRGMMNNEQMAKQCAKCELILTQARNIKLEIPSKNPLPLSRVYQSLGDLAYIREDTQGASSYYQRSFRLMQGSQVPISQTEKIKILEKTHKHYSMTSENFGEQERIKAQLNMLQRQKQLKPVEDRKHFKRIRYLKEQFKNKISEKRNPNSSAIQQVEQVYEEDRSRYPSQQVSR